VGTAVDGWPGRVEQSKLKPFGGAPTGAHTIGLLRYRQGRGIQKNKLICPACLPLPICFVELRHGQTATPLYLRVFGRASMAGQKQEYPGSRLLALAGQQV
jgi:hypothetical protein